MHCWHGVYAPDRSILIRFHSPQLLDVQAVTPRDTNAAKEQTCRRLHGPQMPSGACSRQANVRELRCRKFAHMEPPSPPARPLTRALHSDQVFVARNHLSQGPLNHGLVRTLHVAERTMAALNLMVACAPISRAICDVLPIPASIMIPTRIPRIPQSAGLADPYLVANLQRGHRAQLGVDFRTTRWPSLVLGRTLRDTDPYSCDAHSHRRCDCTYCAVQLTWRRCRRLCTRYQSGFSGPCGLTRTFTNHAAKMPKVLHLFQPHIPHRCRKRRVRT